MNENKKIHWHQLGFFLLFSFLDMYSVNITEDVTLLLDYLVVTKRKTTTMRLLVKRWTRWMRTGLFSRVGAPSYSYHPVHFLGLGNTSCGLPLYGPLPSGIVVTTVMWWSTAVRKFATLLRLLGDWYIFHFDRLRKSIRSGSNHRPSDL